MNPGGDTHQRDWDEQRESISAYVDGALSPDDRAHFEQHLASCPACQREREAMRQVRVLLRRMPQPALPRSFTLPAMPDRQAPRFPEPAPAAAAAPTSTRAARVVPFPQRAGRIAQSVGMLAAAIGVVLLLGSALLGHPGAMGTSNTAASLPRTAGGASGTTATAGQAGPAYGAAQQTPREGTSGAQATESKPAASPAPNTGGQFVSQPTPTATPVPIREPPTSGTGTTVSTTPSEGLPVVPLTGAGLLIGGAAAAVAGRILSRRGRSTPAR